MSFAPYGDATEYGVTYIVLVPGEQPRRVSVWNGNDRSFSAEEVHELRRDIPRPDGVRYVQARLMTRHNPAMVELHQIQKDIWDQATYFGKAWLAPRRQSYPGFPAECITPPNVVIYRSQKERYYLTNDLDEWTLFGTAEGDAWIEQYYADAWKLHLDAAGLVETDRLRRPKPVTQPML